MSNPQKVGREALGPTEGQMADPLPAVPLLAHGHSLTSGWLVGNVQRLKNKDLGKLALREKHVNVPAEVSDSPQSQQHWPREQALQLWITAGPRAS